MCSQQPVIDLVCVPWRGIILLAAFILHLLTMTGPCIWEVTPTAKGDCHDNEFGRCWQRLGLGSIPSAADRRKSTAAVTRWQQPAVMTALPAAMAAPLAGSGQQPHAKPRPYFTEKSLPMRRRLLSSASTAAAAAGDGEATTASSSSGDLLANLDELGAAARRAAIKGTNIVIYVVINFGYLDMFRNWIYHLWLLGYDKNLLVFCVDEETHEFVESNWPGQALRLKAGDVDPEGQFHCNDMDESKVSSTAFNFNSGGFNYITNQRVFFARALLILGFSPLVGDVDMIWVADPLPYFVGGFDVYFSSDTKLPKNELWNQKETVALPEDFVSGEEPNFCMCFFFFRPTSGTMYLVNAWIQQVKQLGCQTKGTTHDQTHFNRLIVHIKQGMPELFPRVGLLSRYSFPNGADFKSAVERLRTGGDHGLATLHVNYIYGKKNKVVALKEAGLWHSFKISEIKGKVHAVQNSPDKGLSNGAGNGDEKKGGKLAVRENAAESVDGQMLTEQQIKELEKLVLAAVKEAAPAVAKERAVIFTFVNNDQVPLFENWLLWLKQSNANDGKVLALTAEESVENLLKGKWASSVVNVGSLSPLLTGRKDLTIFLPFILWQLLDVGYTAIYSEVDTVWLQSPLKLYARKGVDVFIGPTLKVPLLEGDKKRNPSRLLNMEGTILDLSSGFGTLVVHPSKAGISFVHSLLVSLFEALQNGAVLKDAGVEAMCASLRGSLERRELSLNALQGDGFVHEKLEGARGQWTEAYRETIIIAHFTSDTKISLVEFFKENNLWIVS